MKQDNKKKLEQILEKGKEKFKPKEEKRPFKTLQKIKPQEMNIEEKFDFIDESFDKMKIEFSTSLDLFSLLIDLASGEIKNNQASRKLNEIISRIQKEMK